MKIIYNNLIPFKGFMAINLFGVLFVRKVYEGRMNEWYINHEAIHSAQMKELLYIGFYVIYVIEWLIKLFKYGRNAYDNLSFEREAYAHMGDLHYLEKREHYAQWR